MLQEILAHLTSLPEDEIKKIRAIKDKAIGKPVWVPNPGPQTNAYLSKADILLFGGEPGGGKTGLLIGLALNEHRRSLVIRKQFADLDGVLDNAKGLVGSDIGFSGGGGGSRPKYKKPDGGLISFQGMAQGGGLDTGKQGTAYDLIGVDEAAQLPEDDVRLLIGWNRTGPGVPKTQRCRVVLASNPPVNSTGDWLGEFFAPWFDENHPNPAKFGELRWFIFNEEGKSQEVDGPEKVTIDGKEYSPHSRTYINSKVKDNPFIDEEAYQKNLQSIPEPYRGMLLSGNFLAARTDQDFQVIPTAWVRDAQQRWKEHPQPPVGVPMCSMGVDIALGGADNTVISARYDYWFAPLVKIPGKDTPRGNDVAGHIIKHRQHDALIALDMGGGFGDGAWICLAENIAKNKLRSFKGAEAGVGRTNNKQYSFTNKRTEAYWKLREALDPSQLGGSPIMLPPSKQLLSDLTAPVYEIIPRGIKVEPKESVKEKLKRSPDEGDAVVMCWVEGQRGLTPRANYNSFNSRQAKLEPRAIMGYQQRRRK